MNILGLWGRKPDLSYLTLVAVSGSPVIKGRFLDSRGRVMLLDATADTSQITLTITTEVSFRAALAAGHAGATWPNGVAGFIGIVTGGVLRVGRGSDGASAVTYASDANFDPDVFAAGSVIALGAVSQVAQAAASTAVGSSVSIADGADAAEGAIADSVVAAGATGSISAKLRRLTTDIGTLLSYFFAEDAAHTTGDKGIQVLTRRIDTVSSSAGTSGDYATLNTDANGNAWVGLGTLLAGENQTLNRLMVAPNYNLARATADLQVKAGAGLVHTVTFAATGTVVAGVITIYDSLTETGTILWSGTIQVATAPLTITLDGAFATGLFIGYDGTITNVSTTVSYL